MLLKDKIAIITGGAGGIGLAATRLFSENGATVVIFDVVEEAGVAVEREMTTLGRNVKFIKTDISDEQNVIESMKQVEELYGKVDVLYNNASVFLGGGRDNKMDLLDTKFWDKILHINLYGLYHCTKHVIPLMRRAGGGSIINTSSSAGQIGIPECDAYTATKGATTSLTRSLAVEYGPDNIRTNCIAPAAILTDMVKESNLNDPNFDEQKFLTSGTPLRRWGRPEEIASVALFLASDLATYLNGTVIVADGGITVA